LPTFDLAQSLIPYSNGSLISLHNTAVITISFSFFLLGLPSISSTAPVTLIFPSVKVPVLSAQITFTLPKVSAAVNLLTTAFCFKIRCIPIAKITVKLTTKPSGIEATAKATAVGKISSKLSPTAKPANNTNSDTTPTKTASCFDNLSTLICSGVCSAGASFSDLATLPTAVSPPIRITIILPTPIFTSVPIKALCLLSTLSKTPLTSSTLSHFNTRPLSQSYFSTGALSPVKIASFVNNPSSPTKIPSAGTLCSSAK